MATQVKTILVTGATGQQGGAVAQSLLRQGQKVRALARVPEKAQWLAKLGAEVVQGNLVDRASLDRALQGVDGVFGVTTFMEKGMDAEVQQGKTLAEAVKQAGVQHFVFASVGSAERNTGVPHFDTKWQVEQYIRQLGLPATILRPVWFMENFGTFSKPSPEGKLILPLRPDLKMQMIAVKDIGEFGATAFLRPADFIGQAIDLAGDALTMQEVAIHLSRTMGRPITYETLPDDQAEAAVGYDFAVMFKWFHAVGFSVDILGLKQKFGIPLTSFAEVIATADWAK